jgi:peptide/nickel transport system substrate-binding protein
MFNPRNFGVLAILLALAVILATACAPVPAAPPPAQAPAATAVQESPAAGATTASPTTASAGTPKRGGELTLAMHADFTKLDSSASGADSDHAMFFQIYENLIVVDSEMNLQPRLAKSWDVVDDKTVVFHLQEGVKFHDGTDFDAEAVKFNIERMKGEESLRKADIEPIESVEVIDKYTVQFNLSEPFSPLFALLVDNPGFMVSPAAVEKWGADYALHPTGTGPFKFVEYVRGDHLTLERNPDYWQMGADGQPLPYLDRIIAKPVTDSNVRAVQVRTGDVDMTYSLSPSDIQGLTSDPNVTVTQSPGLAAYVMLLNTDQELLSKPEVRQALSMAIDREALEQALSVGSGDIRYGPSARNTAYFDPEFAPHPYDPEKAKELLTRAGFPEGGTIDLMILPNTIYQQLAPAIQAYWEAIGVKTNIRIVEVAAFAEEAQKDTYNAMITSWGNRADPDGNFFRLYHSDGAANFRTRLNDPEMDRLLDATRATYDEQERIAAFQAAEKYIAEISPGIYLYAPANIWAYQNSVKDFAVYPDNYPRLAEVWLDE